MNVKTQIQLSDHFTYGKLLRFVFPSIIIMIFTSIYGVVDGLFVSNFSGKTSFAAINLIMPFVMVLSGFTAGHTKEPGVCAGGVLMFQGCEFVSVDNCGLFGCGILGVQAEGCTGITLRSSDIYECSYGGVSMSDTTGITINDCTFRDLGGNNLMLYGCSDVTVDGEYINGQSYNGR